jgi:hypothetical protein
LCFEWSEFALLGAMMIYHMCISLTGALRNWKDSLYVGCCTDDSGRTMEPYEVKAWFLSALAEGKKVVPMDSSCDNFDFQKGCQGHPDAISHQKETPLG